MTSHDNLAQYLCYSDIFCFCGDLGELCSTAKKDKKNLVWAKIWVFVSIQYFDTEKPYIDLTKTEWNFRKKRTPV